MTLVAGLRAASYGIPFQPVAGVHGSELARINGWKLVTDPYGSGQQTYVIPAIRPDVAVIHAAEIDTEGNARVYGSPFWDHPLTRAAKAPRRGRDWARPRSRPCRPSSPRLTNTSPTN